MSEPKKLDVEKALAELEKVARAGAQREVAELAGRLAQHAMGELLKDAPIRMQAAMSYAAASVLANGLREMILANEPGLLPQIDSLVASVRIALIPAGPGEEPGIVEEKEEKKEKEPEAKTQGELLPTMKKALA